MPEEHKGRDGYTSVASRMLAQLGLEENEELSWGGTCPEIEIPEIQLELGGTNAKNPNYRMRRSWKEEG